MGGGASSQRSVEQQQRGITAAANTSAAASSAGSVAAVLDHTRKAHRQEKPPKKMTNEQINAKLKKLEAQKKKAMENEDFEQCAVVRDQIAALHEQQKAAHMRGENVVFLAKSPKVNGKEAIAFFGDLYKLHGGRGHAVTLGEKKEAVVFVLDGPLDKCAVRIADDQGLALEVNYRKMEVDGMISVWECQKDGKVMKDWSVRFSVNPDGTISPAGHSDLVLGLEKKAEPWQQLRLVKRTDEARRLVFEGNDKMDALWEEMQKERAAFAAEVTLNIKLAGAVCANAHFRQTFKEQGFFHIEGGASPAIVRRALQEINRQVGNSGQSVETFKAKSFPSHPAIKGLFNDSMLPHILQRLLGGDSPYFLGSGQLALRFPGDACPKNECKCSSAHFESVRKSWHIDGCPSNFLPGVTDHFGEVHNFDALCGILLSDVPEPMSGELCTYAGSHYQLAEYFKKHGLDEVAKKGTLPTGAQTDELFGGTKPTHCLGKAGDVFLANYMTAHFIAPNTSPHIRYAVYFRVTGRSHSRKKWQTSMLNPWAAWPGLSDNAIQTTAESGKNRRFRAAVESLEVAMAGQRLTDHLATVDNFHVVQEKMMETVELRDSESAT